MNKLIPKKNLNNRIKNPDKFWNVARRVESAASAVPIPLAAAAQPVANAATLLPAQSVSDANSDLSSSVAPAAPNVLIQLKSTKDVQRHILDPLRMTIGGEFPRWILPVRLNVNGSWVQLHRLCEVFTLHHEQIIGRVLQNREIKTWKPQFYDNEADPTPPFATDTPRLDIVLTFKDGTWLRWHPGSHLI